MMPLRALFEKRINGDDALLRLARRRFDEAGLAAEVYAGSPGELAWILRFAPSVPHLPTVHLPRDIDLLAPDAPDRIRAIAEPFGHQVAGFVIHDRRTMPEQMPALVAAAEQVSSMLAGSGEARLFVEYAAGLEAEQFVAIGHALRDVDRVGLCIDIGHVGIRQARRDFARIRPDVQRDLLTVTVTEPGLPDLLTDVQAAVGSGLGTVLGLIREVGAQGRPVHFHLHDGHPLVQGLADHFGFLTSLPVPMDGVRALSPLYGLDGLRKILAAVATELGPERASLTLEIHQHEGRLQLPQRDFAALFSHWQNLTNAERMNFWLRELTENALLVRALG